MKYDDKITFAATMLLIIAIISALSVNTFAKDVSEIAICRTQLTNTVFICVLSNNATRCHVKLGMKVDPIPCETSICADKPEPIKTPVVSDRPKTIIEILTGK